MIDAGIKPGDHIAVASYNHIMYLPLVLGIIAAGGTPALCNPSYVEREMEGLFATAGAHMAIGHHKNSERVDNVCKKLGLPASLGKSLKYDFSMILLTIMFSYHTQNYSIYYSRCRHYFGSVF